MGIDAGVINRLGSDKRCEVLFDSEWATLSTSGVI